MTTADVMKTEEAKINGQATTTTEKQPIHVHVPTAQRLQIIPWGDDPNGPEPPVLDTDGEVIVDDPAVEAFGSTAVPARSGAHDVVQENGRTYHKFKDGKYFLPNDGSEQERLHLQHALFLLTAQGNLSLAQIDKPLRVLDIGTGTGIWAIDFAHEHPESEVLGVDLSAIQPDYLPQNCTFKIADVEDDWAAFTPNSFDYIHGRALLTCFRDPSSVISAAFAALSLGGYFELQDAVFPMEYYHPPSSSSPPFDIKSTSLHKWGALLVHAAHTSNPPRSWQHVRRYARLLRAAGFVDVVERRFYWPLSPWAKGKYYKQLAAYFRADLDAALEPLSLRSLAALGWSAERTRELLEEVRGDMKDGRIRAYMPILYVYGRKPGGPEHK